MAEDQRVDGDMGVSSERSGPFPSDGVEGTGTRASAQGGTDGETPLPSGDEAADDEHRQAQQVEPSPDPVASHDEVRARR